MLSLLSSQHGDAAELKSPSTTLANVNSTTSEELHNQILRDGFVGVSGLLTEGEKDLLSNSCTEMLEGDAESWDRYFQFGTEKIWRSLLLKDPGRASVFFDFIGQNADVDRILNRLIGNTFVQEFLERTLGAGYHLWYCQIRRAEINGQSQKMHQDLPGELGISILLSEIPTPNGTTVFVKGSHRWPRILRDFPFINPRRIQKWLKGATGKPGDIYFFYNDTWHGRSGGNDKSCTAIILTFLPGNSKIASRKPPIDILDRLGPNIRPVLDSGAHVRSAGLDPSRIGPDEVISERLPPTRRLSLWQPLIIGTFLFGRAIGLHRILRRLLQKVWGKRTP